MLYADFVNKLNQYIEIYNKGLKKQANAMMKETVCQLKSMADSDVDNIIYNFLFEYCDSDVWDVLKERGNGDIPYDLKEFIRIWLTPRCEEKKMPELRWYYQMYHNDRIGYKFADKYLADAYSSDKCDQKTVDMKFNSYLDILGWGAHHFPDGCIIENSDRDNCIKNCEKIMRENTVSEHLLNELQYYKILYACYEKYEKDGRIRDFDTYLKEGNLNQWIFP